MLETGVAAGFSSAAILEALHLNGAGVLHSIDLPYFRLREAERHVGALVPENLHTRWHLHLGSDRKLLRSVVGSIGPIDLFHYDSDKSLSGRQFALRQVRPAMSASGMLIFDDIDDNDHFERTASSEGVEPVVFEFCHKFLGVLDLSGGQGRDDGARDLMHDDR